MRSGLTRPYLYRVCTCWLTVATWRHQWCGACLPVAGNACAKRRVWAPTAVSLLCSMNGATLFTTTDTANLAANIENAFDACVYFSCRVLGSDDDFDTSHACATPNVTPAECLKSNEHRSLQILALRNNVDYKWVHVNREQNALKSSILFTKSEDVPTLSPTFDWCHRFVKHTFYSSGNRPITLKSAVSFWFTSAVLIDDCS